MRMERNSEENSILTEGKDFIIFILFFIINTSEYNKSRVIAIKLIYK